MNFLDLSTKLELQLLTSKLEPESQSIQTSTWTWLPSNSQFFLPIYCFSGCKTCKVCLDGNYHFCQKGSLRTTIGIGRNGSFAKFCIVPLEQVYLIPDSVTLEQGALCEPLSCILRGTVFENWKSHENVSFEFSRQKWSKLNIQFLARKFKYFYWT